ncbi:MAG TPA: N-methyl-L-tryptophan oxidase [Vicinamibacterales bacterium]|nr:N-methyl-L-tryptophan oxidase [Vicinamibacterales bacterium]
MSTFDVIVVGLGGMGSAASAHAALRGKRVLGLEQFEPAHDQGSSHGRSRVIRLAYFEHPAYVPLLQRAYELWRRLEQRTGRRLLQITGGLMIGHPESDVVAGSLRSAREHHLDHELLDAAEIHSRFPALTPGRDVVALFERDAGIVFPEEAIRAHLDVAVDNGAHVHFNERVDGWEAGAAGTIHVRTSRGRYEADRVILAPGSWAQDLFKMDSLPLEVEPQQLHWFDPGGGPAPFMPDRFPIYIWDLGNGVQFYGFPADDEGRVKVAFFRSKIKGEAAMRNALAPCIPAIADGTLLETVNCKYTLTPDHHFVIGPHPDHSNVVIASPCSGHGYKFASVIGEVLADLAIDGATRHPIDLFSPERFRHRPS